MPQTVLELNESERRWIDAHLRVARSTIKAFAPDHGQEITLRALDAAFGAWLAQHDPTKEDPNPYINAFGVAFGQHFVDELHFTWVLVQDEHGTQMAVHGAPGDQPGDVFVYPPNFVSKRYLIKTTDFFERTFQEMRGDIEHPPNAPAKKPGWKFWSKKR